MEEKKKNKTKAEDIVAKLKREEARSSRSSIDKSKKVLFSIEAIRICLQSNNFSRAKKKLRKSPQLD